MFEAMVNLIADAIEKPLKSHKISNNSKEKTNHHSILFLEGGAYKQMSILCICNLYQEGQNNANTISLAHG